MTVFKVNETYLSAGKRYQVISRTDKYIKLEEICSSRSGITHWMSGEQFQAKVSNRTYGEYANVKQGTMYSWLGGE